MGDCFGGWERSDNTLCQHRRKANADAEKYRLNSQVDVVMGSLGIRDIHKPQKHHDLSISITRVAPSIEILGFPTL